MNHTESVRSVSLCYTLVLHSEVRRESDAVNRAIPETLWPFRSIRAVTLNLHAKWLQEAIGAASLLSHTTDYRLDPNHTVLFATRGGNCKKKKKGNRLLDNCDTVNSILCSDPSQRLGGVISEVEYKAIYIYKPAVCFQTVTLKRIISLSFALKWD